MVRKVDTQTAVEIYNYIRETVLEKELIRFLVVGGIVFVSNTILLFVFHGLLKADLLISQIIAAELSIIISFCLHHTWTYRHYGNKPLWQRFLSFNGSAIGGQVIATVTLLFCANVLHINYLLGFAIGALLAIVWNYFANKYFIWSSV